MVKRAEEEDRPTCPRSLLTHSQRVIPIADLGTLVRPRADAAVLVAGGLRVSRRLAAVAMGGGGDVPAAAL